MAEFVVEFSKDGRLVEPNDELDIAPFHCIDAVYPCRANLAARRAAVRRWLKAASVTGEHVAVAGGS